MLPPFFSGLAPAWPAWHLAQLALSVVGLGGGHVAMHAVVLAGVSVVFFLLARRRLARG
jgi:ABC-2 type transport system permease protein